MSIINTLREKSWLALVFVGLALVAFILGDIFGPNSVLRGGPDRAVGQIDGESVSAEEYQQQIEQLKYEYALQTNQNPDESAMEGIREQAWNQLIFNRAYSRQFEQLGLVVPEEEKYDMVQGQYIHPAVRASFTNPQTNEFDLGQLRGFLANLEQAPPEQQAMWYNFEARLVPDRMRTKYEALFSKTAYVTKAEAQREYQAQQAEVSLRYLFVPFSAVPDSTVDVTDAQLNAYLQSHRREFESSNTRTFDYVVFSVSPSAADSSLFMNDLRALAGPFKQAENDSLFVQNNADAYSPARVLGPGELPLDLTQSALQAGEVYGPFVNNTAFSIYKVVDVRQTDDLEVRASHILFRADDDTDEAKRKARAQAQSVLDQIKAGASFAEMAKLHGTDGTAPQGGDLGWFAKNRMVKPFEEAVFSRSTPGLLDQIVETQFGFHLIEVTAAPTGDKYEVYELTRNLTPGDGAFDQAYSQAARFAAAANDLASFESQAEAAGLRKETAYAILPDARRVNTLTNVREMIRWAFNDAKVGSVSPVFESDDQYIVAVMTAKTDKNEVSLASAREAVTQKVRNERKAEKIRTRLGELGKGSLDSVAQAYGSEALLNSVPNLKLSTNTLSSLGFDPTAVGYAFGMAPGTTSAPIVTDNGVAMFRIESVKEAPEVADYASQANTVRQQRAGRVAYYVGESIKELAEVDDKRYRFY